ncbi:hypothetical protein PAUR_a0976 [Pseudoalteromonas aurantia 208]|uniref:Orphan protein n=1 Tax=Pseudoalteromonas aurantia 208 TaxID=1314867 RepID=A0ABR9E9B6_9GAMM|nr:hypothetical protein [Pseudoalteromonas aurantia 208]
MQYQAAIFVYSFGTVYVIYKRLDSSRTSLYHCLLDVFQ